MKKSDDKVIENKSNEEVTEVVDPGEEWRQKYLRVLADYQNLDQRSRVEREEMRKYAAEMVLKKLLPVFDNFILAGVHLKDAGLDLALKELETKLIELGVSKIDAVGKQFNPEEMECIEVIEGVKEAVIEEIRVGYKLNEKVLRVAQVKVGGGA